MKKRRLTFYSSSQQTSPSHSNVHPSLQSIKSHSASASASASRPPLAAFDQPRMSNQPNDTSLQTAASPDSLAPPPPPATSTSTSTTTTTTTTTLMNKSKRTRTHSIIGYGVSHINRHSNKENVDPLHGQVTTTQATFSIQKDPFYKRPKALCLVKPTVLSEPVLETAPSHRNNPTHKLIPITVSESPNNHDQRPPFSLTTLQRSASAILTTKPQTEHTILNDQSSVHNKNGQPPISIREENHHYTSQLSNNSHRCAPIEQTNQSHDFSAPTEAYPMSEQKKDYSLIAKQQHQPNDDDHQTRQINGNGTDPSSVTRRNSRDTALTSKKFSVMEGNSSQNKDYSINPTPPRYASVSYTADYSTLPYDCIYRIFSFLCLEDLGTCAVVCKAWKQVTHHSSLWGSLQLTGFQELSNNSIATLLTRAGDNLRHFTVSMRSGLNESHLKTILPENQHQSNCPKLKVLSFDQCSNLTPELMKKIFRCPRPVLELLQLEGPPGKGLLNDDCIQTIMKSAPNVRRLNLSENPDLTDRSLFSIFTHAFFLKVLNMAMCPKVSSAFMHLVPSTLKYLDFSGTQICDNGLSCIANNCPNLKLLHVSMCENNITDLGVQAIAEKCTMLQDVSLLMNYSVGDLGIKSLLKNCSLLKRLSLVATNITDRCWSTLVDDEVVTRLRFLNLNSTDLQQGIFHIPRVCPLLKEIRLVHCDYLTEDMIDRFRNMYDHDLDIMYLK